MQQQSIEQQIQNKLLCDSKPFFPDPSTIYSTPTDMNEFPYRRFFRGNFESSYPIVYERTAGYAPIIQTIKPSPPATLIHSTGCFQTPCSTVLPCNPQKTHLSPSSGCVRISP